MGYFRNILILPTAITIISTVIVVLLGLVLINNAMSVTVKGEITEKYIDGGRCYFMIKSGGFAEIKRVDATTYSSYEIGDDVYLYNNSNHYSDEPDDFLGMPWW